MKQSQSLAHIKWEYEYHIVIGSQYRKKVIYWRTSKERGKIIPQLWG